LFDQKVTKNQAKTNPWPGVLAGLRAAQIMDSE
jgi:hypothetical protein